MKRFNWKYHGTDMNIQEGHTVLVPDKRKIYCVREVFSFLPLIRAECEDGFCVSLRTDEVRRIL